jgi:dTMP kinase
VHADLAPDCTLLLDLPVSVGLGRARAREAGAADRFEAETVAFFERVRAGYLELARREPRRFQVLDATAALAAVEARVEGLLEALA